MQWSDPTLDVSQRWKSYNIANSILNIRESLDEIKESSIKACWQKLWPEAVNNFSSFPSFDNEVRNNAQMVQQVEEEGFEDLETTEVEELIQSYAKEQTEEDLLKSGEDDDDSEDELVSKCSKQNVNIQKSYKCKEPSQPKL